jgi:uncharacterized protein (UPF0216 family)
LSEADFLEVFLREELRIVNRHAPRERLSICELMKSEVPHVRTFDGAVHMIDPRELELLNNVVHGDCSLKLPIVIEYIPEGEGLYVVKDEPSINALVQVLNLNSWSKPLVLYRPQVLELRRILRTTTTILLSPRIIGGESGWLTNEW